MSWMNEYCGVMKCEFAQQINHTILYIKLQSRDLLTVLLLINYCSDCLDRSVNVSCHNTPPQYRNQLFQVFRPPEMMARASNCLEVASASLRL